MYSSTPGVIYGFHGIDESVAIKILNQNDEFIISENSYDWLGKGVYFWENNYERAKQYAEEDCKRLDSKIKTPFVLGAVIDLGNCLDLLNQEHLNFLGSAYETLAFDLRKEKKELPTNSKFNSKDFDFKNRKLDCAVVQYAHKIAKTKGIQFDSVRSAFWEGEDLYSGAGFKAQNHIQIAILNPNCIKGIFIPREIDNHQFSIQKNPK